MPETWQFNPLKEAKRFGSLVGAARPQPWDIGLWGINVSSTVKARAGDGASLPWAELPCWWNCLLLTGIPGQQGPPGVPDVGRVCLDVVGFLLPYAQGASDQQKARAQVHCQWTWGDLGSGKGIHSLFIRPSVRYPLGIHHIRPARYQDAAKHSRHPETPAYILMDGGRHKPEK